MKSARTILVVEDQGSISEAERIALTKVGYRILVARTGEAAIGFVKEHEEIDLVLMDISLGEGFDGIEAAKLILRDRELPLVFVSGTDDREIIERMASVSAYGFVAKRAGIAAIDTTIRMAFRLFDATERERRMKATLEATLEENKLLLREVQHRAKNSFTMISSMIQIASIHLKNEEGRIALEELGARVQSVAELYSLLYSSGSVRAVRLDDYCRRVCSAVIGLSASVSLAVDLEAMVIPVPMAAPIGLILTELATNALKYAFKDRDKGAIRISLKREGPLATLEVADDGVGIFGRPAAPETLGIGLSLVRGLARQLQGGFETLAGDPGTRCVLRFPLPEEGA